MRMEIEIKVKIEMPVIYYDEDLIEGHYEKESIRYKGMNFSKSYLFKGVEDYNKMQNDMILLESYKSQNEQKYNIIKNRNNISKKILFEYIKTYFSNIEKIGFIFCD